MKNLNDAITDLTDTIRNDGFSEGLVEEVAMDWGVNPILLSRKFEEKYGKPASEWEALSDAAMRNLAIDRAMIEAVAYRAEFTDTPGVPEITGRAFTCDGEDYIAVAIATGGLRAIKVSNGKRGKFGNSGADAYAVARCFNLI